MLDELIPCLRLAVLDKAHDKGAIHCKRSIKISGSEALFIAFARNQSFDQVILEYSLPVHGL